MPIVHIQRCAHLGLQLPPECVSLRKCSRKLTCHAAAAKLDNASFKALDLLGLCLHLLGCGEQLLLGFRAPQVQYRIILQGRKPSLNQTPYDE